MVDIVRTATRDAENPKFGTLKGKVAIHDPDWWKPMSEQEADAFLNGRN
ncbi:MAG TPA: hypothetical protein VK670_08615 [Silvibacterium sp.]|nr:hypothetical protein [Silvibacterium sp.]